MSKLERLSRESQRLLRLLGDDLGIQSDGTWVAMGFYDQGVGFDATYQATDVDDLQAEHYIHTLDQVLRVDAERNWVVSGVTTQTLVQSATLAKLAGDGETVRVGLYNGTTRVDWRPLVKSRAQALVEHFDQVVRYRGMLQGIIHSLFKEADPPHFNLRDLASGALARCLYEPAQYDDIYAALQRKNAVVLVAGWIETKRSERGVRELQVERIRATEPLNKEDLEAFFSSAPGWTGDLTTDEFIDAARRREDGE